MANTVICLIHQANYLLDQQLAALERAFVQDGGYSERLAAARIAHRQRRKDQQDLAGRASPRLPDCPLCGKPMVLRHLSPKGKTVGANSGDAPSIPPAKALGAQNAQTIRPIRPIRPMTRPGNREHSRAGRAASRDRSHARGRGNGWRRARAKRKNRGRNSAEYTAYPASKGTPAQKAETIRPMTHWETASTPEFPIPIHPLIPSAPVVPIPKATESVESTSRRFVRWHIA